MPNEPSPSPKKKPPYNNLTKYSGMAIQMAVIITLGTWGGIKLDAYFGLKKFPVFTLILSLLSVAASIYLSIKDFLKK